MEFSFLTDWFSPHIPLWKTHLSSLAGKKICALEIGSWEGRATCWLLTNILTHDASRITCIDPFPVITNDQIAKYASRWNLAELPTCPISIEERFNANIQATGSPEKVIKKVGFSKHHLHTLSDQKYDLIYIDGSHFQEDVLYDLVLCWDLIQDGGILILDDYGLHNVSPELGNPKVAIDAFLSVFGEHCDVLHKEWQVIVKKRAGRREKSDYPPIGQGDDVSDRKKDLVSITCARNEEDILESFVRYHCAIFDRMIIVLHNCTDRSYAIVDALKKEGLPIEMMFDHTAYFAQSEIVTGLLHTVEHAEWIFPLDADEFLIATEGNPRDILLSSDTNHPYTIPWVTYVPTPHDDPKQPDPIKRIQHRRVHEPRSFSKVLIPAHLASRISLPRGNHSILSDEPIDTPEHPTLRIAHFPVRTEQQLRTKVIDNWASVQKNPAFIPGTSFQWEQLIDRCKNPAEITKEELCRIALRYALKPQDPETSYILDGTLNAHDT